MLFVGDKYTKIRKLLQLDKPLVIFDLETTGKSLSSDKIIQLAYVKIHENGRTKQDALILNPEIKISLEATSIHGIRNRDVKDQPTFKDKAQEVWDVFADSQYAGFNVLAFDLPLLKREFARVGMDFDFSSQQVIDAKEIFRYLAPRTIGMAYEYYCRKRFERSDAPHHVDATADIIAKQLEQYAAVRDPEFRSHIHGSSTAESGDTTRKIYWISGEPYFAFSKYRDWRVSEVAKHDRAFLEWILNADFGAEVKQVVKHALNGEKKT